MGEMTAIFRIAACMRLQLGLSSASSEAQPFSQRGALREMDDEAVLRLQPKLIAMAAQALAPGDFCLWQRVSCVVQEETVCRVCHRVTQAFRQQQSWADNSNEISFSCL